MDMGEGEGMKVVVTGNCQARPLANLLGSLPKVEITDVIILHLAREDQEQAHQEAIHAADVIVAQCTDEGFKPSHLRSSALRASGKAIIWPNIFFSGQQPFLRYVVSPKFGRLNGPLDVYHDVRIMTRWHLERFEKPLFDECFDADFAERLADQSLKELARREGECDVSVVGKISSRWKDERLFFTFNHPSMNLLSYVVELVSDKIGLSHSFRDIDFREPLDKIIPPSIFDENTIDDTPRFQGVATLGGGIKQNYSWQSLVKASFDAYDLQREAIMGSGLRLTPSYC
jgi:hypothetical protein